MYSSTHSYGLRYLYDIYTTVIERISSGADPSIAMYQGVPNAARHLKLGKHDGEGVLSSNHLVNTPNELVFLSCRASLLVCFVIDAMKTCCIIPILESKQSVCASASREGIALCYVTSKIVDNNGLEHLSEYLIISDLQFQTQSFD